jgi:uncharacterized protein YraI
MVGGTSAPAPTKAPVVKTAAAPLVLVTHAANLRAAPSGKAAIAVAIPRGTKVSVGEKQGSWTRVTVAETKQQGWVYSAYLASEPEPPADKPADKPGKHRKPQP